MSFLSESKMQKCKKFLKNKNYKKNEISVEIRIISLELTCMQKKRRKFHIH